MVVAERDELLTVAELAAEWRLSSRMIYKLIREARLPVVRFGTRGGVRIRREDALAYFRSRRNTGQTKQD